LRLSTPAAASNLKTEKTNLLDSIDKSSMATKQESRALIRRLRPDAPGEIQLIVISLSR